MQQERKPDILLVGSDEGFPWVPAQEHPLNLPLYLAIKELCSVVALKEPTENWPAVELRFPLKLLNPSETILRVLPDTSQSPLSITLTVGNMHLRGESDEVGAIAATRLGDLCIETPRHQVVISASKTTTGWIPFTTIVDEPRPSTLITAGVQFTRQRRDSDGNLIGEREDLLASGETDPKVILEELTFFLRQKREEFMANEHNRKSGFLGQEESELVEALTQKALAIHKHSSNEFLILGIPGNTGKLESVVIAYSVRNGRHAQTATEDEVTVGTLKLPIQILEFGGIWPAEHDLIHSIAILFGHFLEHEARVEGLNEGDCKNPVILATSVVQGF